MRRVTCAPVRVLVKVRPRAYSGLAKRREERVRKVMGWGARRVRVRDMVSGVGRVRSRVGGLVAMWMVMVGWVGDGGWLAALSSSRGGGGREAMVGRLCGGVWKLGVVEGSFFLELFDMKSRNWLVLSSADVICSYFLTSFLGNHCLD